MPYVLGADFARCINRFPPPVPFGEDVRYDPLYEGLRVEIDKLTSGASQSGTDWKGVRKSSLELLATKSKDLTVASYLTLALFYMEGYGGLADGLEIVLQYLEDGWDGIFPLRPKPRAGAIQMLSERLSLYIGAKALEPAEVALATAVQERLQALQKLVQERMPDAVSFVTLNQTLREQLAAASPPATAPGEPAAEPERATLRQEDALSLPPPPAAVSAASATGAEEVTDRIRVLIPALRQADPLSPVPYRLLRALKWDLLPAPPPLDPASANPGTTRIPPPRIQQKLALEGLFAAAHWAELLRASEAAFQESTGTFWLDLQRYTAAALEGLDREAGKRPAAAIKEEVARLLARLDSLPTLFFADRKVPTPGKPSELMVERTPFASDATRQWLDSLEAAAGGGEAAPMALPAARAVEPGEAALSPADARKVQELLAKQQPGPAFDLLQASIERAPNLRSRFRARLAAARLCLQANQAGWARSLLEELLRESEVVSFEDWEPETAVDLYQLLALCYARPAKRGGPQDPEAAREQLENLRRKLFRLDLRAAAALEEALRR